MLNDANDHGMCCLQFPCALQALRAPQLRTVRLVGHNTLTKLHMHKESRPMPVKARNLAWLLHHPRLERVDISTSKASCSNLVPLPPCFLHMSQMIQ